MTKYTITWSQIAIPSSYACPSIDFR